MSLLHQFIKSVIFIVWILEFSRTKLCFVRSQWSLTNKIWSNQNQIKNPGAFASTEIRTDRQPQNITTLVSTIDAVETSKITLNVLKDSSSVDFLLSMTVLIPFPSLWISGSQSGDKWCITQPDMLLFVWIKRHFLKGFVFVLMRAFLLKCTSCEATVILNRPDEVDQPSPSCSLATWR